MRFEGNTVVITGAAGGFGTELCRLFGERGARIEALDIDARALARLKKTLPRALDIGTAVLDVTNGKRVNAYAAKLAREKKIPRVWINNAGTAYPEAFENAPAARFQRTLDVNLNGVLNGTRAALRLMQNGTNPSGTIVNVASVTGYLPSPFLTSYATSKFAVVGFTKSLQLELLHRGSPVKLVLVSPGFADTALLKANVEFPLPKIVSWMTARPETVARNILDAVIQGKDEIFPGLNARVLLAIGKFAPKAVFRAFTRLLAARNLKETIGWEHVRADKSHAVTDQPVAL
jgi:short-subunit dehydrogenase